MIPSMPIDENEVFNTAHALGPMVAGAADRAEAERAVVSDVISSLRDAGVFRLCVPRALGGVEGHVSTLLRTIETVAESDASTGWCVMIGATSGLVAGYLDDASGAEVFARNPSVVTGGVFAPSGKAVAEAGGFRVSGRWAFASGISHCDWLMGGCLVMDEGRPRTLPGGAPDVRLMLFPREEVEVIDTWTVSGLCGTGSHDMQVSDVFVPAGRSASLVSDLPHAPGPLYRFPVFAVLAAGIAAVSLGVARRAIDEIVALASVKTPTGSRKRLGARAYTQMSVAEGEATLGSARAFLFETVGEAWAAAETGAAIPVTEKARLRLAASHAVKAAAAVVDRMYELGGGTSVYRTSVLQRCLRDVHTATQHLMVSQSTYELAGRVLLGEDVDTSQL